MACETLAMARKIVIIIYTSNIPIIHVFIFLLLVFVAVYLFTSTVAAFDAANNYKSYMPMPDLWSNEGSLSLRSSIYAHNLGYSRGKPQKTPPDERMIYMQASK